MVLSCWRLRTQLGNLFWARAGAWESPEVISGKTTIYISLSMLSNNSAFICLPLASVCDIYLFVSGHFLLIGNQPCPRRCRGKGLAPVACAPLCGSQPAVLQLFSLPRPQGFKLGGFPELTPMLGGRRWEAKVPHCPAGSPAAGSPLQGDVWGAVCECQVLLWDTGLRRRK